jgi:hypothetical protein
VVVRGGGRMKLDDEVVAVKEWDVVRVPPGTWRGYEGGPEGLGGAPASRLSFSAPDHDVPVLGTAVCVARAVATVSALTATTTSAATH